jgi:hypothetical protein
VAGAFDQLLLAQFNATEDIEKAIEAKILGNL